MNWYMKLRKWFRNLTFLPFGPDIFISYRTADARQYAEALRDILSRNGLNCFLDAERLKLGARLEECKH